MKRATGSRSFKLMFLYLLMSASPGHSLADSSTVDLGDSVDVSPGDVQKEETQGNESSAVHPSSKETIEIMNLDNQLAFAISNLAEKLSINEQEIGHISTAVINWRSGALGCPRPGKMYTQALVPGILILLNVNGSSYRYHASSEGMPFYCPDKFAETPSDARTDM